MLNNAFKADLHVHSTSSDGVLSPVALVECAMRAGLSCLALTDHDTLSGLREALDAAAHREGLAVITGLELSAGSDGETHVLGYGGSPDAPALSLLFKRLRDERAQRGREMAQRLALLGMPLPIEELLAGAHGTFGRPHIARALIKRGYAQDMQDAFSRFLTPGCPAYVPRKPLPVSEAIQTLRKAGFVPVLAHPGLLKTDEPTFFSLLDAWRAAGLMGIEAYHPANAQERGCGFYEAAARQRGLLVTGGSDFHDGEPPHAALGAMADDWHQAQADINALLSAQADLAAAF